MEQTGSIPPAGGSILGTRVNRVEDDSLLRGEGTFVENLELTGAAHVVFVRSGVAHGELVDVDPSEALDAPGVVAVITADDLDLAPLAPALGMAPPGMARPLLATDRVRFVGEPIAAVVAETRAQAVDAAERVIVEVDPLAAVVDAERAATDELVLYPEVGTNTAVTIAAPDSADLGDRDPFDGCEVVVSQRIVNQRLAPVPLEVRVAASRWRDGRLTHWSTTQNPHGVRDGLAVMFGLDQAQVRVICPDVGGGFGPKNGLYPEERLTAELARRLDRPVRWVETRSESMLGLGHGRAQVQHATIGGRRDGTVLAYRLDVIQDSGAYPSVGAVLPFMTRLMGPGTYDIASVSVSASSVVTNTVPVEAYRGAGRPEATAAIERMMDCFAAELGMDAVEVRRRNLIAGPFPFTTPTGATYDSGEYAGALDKALTAAGYSELRSEQRRRRAAGEAPLLGIGVSTYVEVTNGLRSGEHGSIEVHPDGSALVRTGSSAHGQGHHTAFAMIASAQTGIPIEAITVRHGDTEDVVRGGGTGGSKSLQVGGTAVLSAADVLVDRAREVAADVLEAAPSDIVLDLDRAVFHVAGTPSRSVGWAELATHVAELATHVAELATHVAELATHVAERGTHVPELATHVAERSTQAAVADEPATGVLSVLQGEADLPSAAATFPFGAHVAVVEIDPETGKVDYLRHVACDDAGRILNPTLVDGQVHGGIAQGAAQVLFEQMVYDEAGNPLTVTLGDYLMPSAAELPSFERVESQTETPINPLGAKGIGESGTIGATPALQSAVVDALAYLGVRHLDLPITPERIWRALEAAALGPAG